MKFVLSCLFFCTCITSYTQGCFPHIPDTTITLTCSVNCTDLHFAIPDLKGTGEYRVMDIPYTPFPFTDRSGTAVTFTGGTVWPGNSYSASISLPFSFCFFDSVYNSFAAGANGCITFDASMALQVCNPLLKRGSATFPLPSVQYARALIAGVMHDLDPGDTARVSPNKKIEYRIEGSEPCRKVIISYFEVPLWPGPQRNCQASLNTHQIVLYESTGIIDVFVKDAPQCPGSNEGYNTLAIQNFNRDQAYAPRSRNCTQWGGSNLNLGYRFLPAGGASLFRNAKLYLNGREIDDGVTQPGAITGTLDVLFKNVCPSSSNSTYVVRAFYNSCTGTGVVTYEDTIYVVKSNSLNATAAVERAVCNSRTGSIQVNVPRGGGVPPLQYSLNGGPPQATNVFSNLPAGSYTIVVADAGTCSDTLRVNVPSVNTLLVTLAVTPASCNGAHDGSIKVEAGGQPPFLYSVNGGVPQPGNTFTNLPTGTYTVSVSDAAGCIRNSTGTVLAGTALAATYSKRDITCYGQKDGSVTITPTSGTAPYQYSIDGVNYQQSNIFTGLAGGDYAVRFRDRNGCTGDLFVFVAQPRPLQAAATVRAARCYGESNGSLTLEVQGGSPPYQYSLDGVLFQPSAVFTVGAGTYQVWVRDGNGCLTNIPGLTVTQPAPLSAAAASRNATCIDDGGFTVTAGGGSGNYQYALTAGAYQLSNVFAVPAGTYTPVVKDDSGCTFTLPAITVGLTGTLTLTPDSDKTICEGDSVQLAATSNAAQYLWTPATNLIGTTSGNPIVFPRSSTDYFLAATLGTCTAYDTVTVWVRPAPVPDAGPDGDICYGQTYGLQGSGGISYLWTPAVNLSTATGAHPIATPDKTVQYALQVKDANNCRSLQPDRVTIRVTPAITITVTKDTIAAQGDQFRLYASSVAGNYLWTPASGLSNGAVPDPVVTVSSDITYKVTVTTDASCTGEAFVAIKVYKGPELYVPTAFTPNGDGKNDRFFPFPVGIKSLHYFRVYNRWGELLFSTHALREGWDGTKGGRLQPTGVFVWMAEGVTAENKVITKKGTVTLIR